MTARVALEVRGLTRTYGRITAVDNLDLTVHEGDVYGFLGPNGAGKTTAMRCILGLIKKNQGTVTIFGQSNIRIARQQVGAIIETPAFHKWLSGRDNLKLACAYAGLTGKPATDEIERVLARVGLSERADDRAGGYSLGMRQRLGIARALLGQPKILFLDEPTNGLDPKGMREMRDLIRSLALHDKITVFVSSHLLAEVQAICNRVGIIQNGKLEAEGTVASLVGQSDDAEKTAETVEIGSEDRAGLERVLQTLDAVTILGMGDAGRVRIELMGMSISALNAALVGEGLPIDALVPMRRNLEDVFLEVVQ